MTAELPDAGNIPLFMIHSSEMDFVTLIEHDYPPPMAFKDRHALKT